VTSAVFPLRGLMIRFQLLQFLGDIAGGYGVRLPVRFAEAAVVASRLMRNLVAARGKIKDFVGWRVCLRGIPRKLRPVVPSH
jgi:hypothetical protein